MAKAATERLTKERRAQAIAALQDSQGRVTPRSVWQAARDPLHPLHNEFEWDLKKAAEREWDRTAAGIIREVKFEVIYEETKIIAPYYVSDPRATTSTYIPTIRVAKNVKLKTSVLREEVDRIVSAINRGIKLASAFGLVRPFEAMLEEARGVEITINAYDEDEGTAGADRLGDRGPVRQGRRGVGKAARGMAERGKAGAARKAKAAPVSAASARRGRRGMSSSG